MATAEEMAELETVDEEEVLRRLATGLTAVEAPRRLRLHGPNVVARPHHEGSMFRVFLMTIFSLWGWHHVFPEYKTIFSLWGWHHVFPEYKTMVCAILNSMSWVTVLTTVVSLAVASADKRSYMLAAFIFLLATTSIACITAKLAVEYAKSPLEAKAYAPRAKVLRDGSWIDVHATNLVPGDIIFLKVGDIVPANARVLRFQKIDTMTCWAKRSIDCVHGFLIYYAWTVSCGQGTAVVIATGSGIPRCTLRLYPQRYARPGQLKEGIMVAGCFCFSLILVGTLAEVVLILLFRKHSPGGMLHNCHFMPLIGGIPMAMPVVIYLALALGSLRLCFLGIASRGTVALEDLASMDVMLFNLTEPIDAAVLSLLDDPEQARAGIEVLEHHERFFVALKLMFLTTYIDSNGAKWLINVAPAEQSKRK
uniref:Cation-transporting P-type ATPase N-terminal domain-containing protein n=1 Tax=Hordeum vulgare subsp. vulgare TaxID=112509 RepID=A0A8I7B7T4_HORVV